MPEKDGWSLCFSNDDVDKSLAGWLINPYLTFWTQLIKPTLNNPLPAKSSEQLWNWDIKLKDNNINCRKKKCYLKVSADTRFKKLLRDSLSLGSTQWQLQAGIAYCLFSLSVDKPNWRWRHSHRNPYCEDAVIENPIVLRNWVEEPVLKISRNYAFTDSLNPGVANGN